MADQSNDKPKNYKASLREIVFDKPFQTPVSKIASLYEGLFALEIENHRILSIKSNKIVGQIGKIGNSKGEFYYPEDFVIDKNRTFYVIDAGNSRLQILDQKGEHLYEFPVGAKSLGLATNSKEEIYLGQPTLDSLISVYSPKGKVLRSFGSLISPSEIYGVDYKKYDGTHKIPMNRVRIAIDNNDCIWLGFVHMPLVLSYNQKGELIYKKILNLSSLEPLKMAIWQRAGQQQYMSINIDGIQLVVIIKDVAINPQNNLILVLMGDDSIIGMDQKGEVKYVIKTIVEKGTLSSICAGENGEIYLTSLFAPKVYRLVMCPEGD
jgi:hypothetical protein